MFLKGLCCRHWRSQMSVAAKEVLRAKASLPPFPGMT